MKLRHVIAIAGVAAAGYFFAVVPNEHAKPAAQVQGSAAPDFALPDLSGHTVALSSYRGHPVLVNFWATWCPPCRAEIPDLQKLSETHCVEVVGVALGSGDATAVSAFAKEHKMTYPLLIGNDQIGSDYGVATIPQSVLIDAQGNAVAHYNGMISPPEVRAAVQRLSPGTC